MKAQKLPVVVDAVPFILSTKPWPEGVYAAWISTINGGVLARYVEGVGLRTPARQGYAVDTVGGPVEVTPGDWIITGVEGERYPCKPHIFAQTYQPV